MLSYVCASICLSFTVNLSAQLSYCLPENVTMPSQIGKAASLCNVAGLVDDTKSYGILCYSHDYCLPELWNLKAAYVLKFHKCAVVTRASVKGPSDFIETAFETACAIKLLKPLFVGASISGLYFYPNNSFAVGCKLDAQYRLDDIVLAMSAEYPKILPAQHDFKLIATTLKASLSWTFFDRGELTAGVVKQYAMPLEFISAICLNVLPVINISVVYHAPNNEITCGLYAKVWRIVVCANVTCNFLLGVTPEIVIIIH